MKTNKVERNNLTIHGIHDKTKDKVSILSKRYLFTNDETEAPFLITRNHYFVTTTQGILKTLSNYDAVERFSSTKSAFANILVVPGLVVSFAYIAQLFGAFQQVAAIEAILSSSALNLVFGLAVLGVVILWHDYYRTRMQQSKLVRIESIPEKETEEIYGLNIRFARYAQLEATHFLSEDSILLLGENIGNDGVTVEKMYKAIFSTQECADLLKRANLTISPEDLETHDINAQTLPNVPISALRSLLIYAAEEALLTNSNYIEPIHFFLAITKIYEQPTKMILSLNSTISILRGVVRYNEREKRRRESTSYFNPSVPYHKTGGIAKSWIYGYTWVLNHFSKDVNQQVALERDRYGVGHEKEVETLVSILGRPSKKHALLIGEAGVGKSSLIKGVAQKINRGDVPVQLADKRVVQLDVNGLIAYASRTQNIEAVVQKAMEELAKAGNTILFIDEMQELIPAKASEPGHSIASILLPHVLEGKFPIVGTVNHADYKKYFYTNESFRQSFTNIEVSELSVSDAIKILETKIPILEDLFNIYITYPAIVASAELAQRYITNRMLPDSAVNVLEATCSWAQANGVTTITDEHVAKSVSLQTNIEVEAVDTQEADKLMTLDEKMKRRVIGQDEAINTIVEAIRRSRTGLRSKEKPIGVFLFIGPTGVGKTHLAKVLADEFFNDRNDMVRVDMSEFQDEGSAIRFLGTQKDNGIHAQSAVTLLDRVRTNPYTVVLFDEVEKANPGVLDLFIQMFDEGRLTSSIGETVDFTNTIIICTSNIGSDILLKELEKENILWEEAESKVIMELKQKIRPELYNRFDSIIVFEPHTQDELAKITQLLLGELSQRVAEQNMTLEWADTVPMLIASKAYEPGFGARPLKRYIQEKIEGRIATEILEQKLKAGSHIQIKEGWII